MTVVTAQEAERLIDAESYHRNGYPWEVWARLRKDDPVKRMETPSGEVYWAVSRYKDIVDIECNPAVFLSEPRLAMRQTPRQTPIRQIVEMDPPDHGAYRKFMNVRFMPRNIAWVQDYVERIVARTLDEAMALDGEVFDMQKVLANPVPTGAISRFLGISDDLAPSIHAWTEQSLYPGDPEVAKGRPAGEVRNDAVQSMFAVFRELFEERRKTPRNDLLTDLLNSRVNGEVIGDLELYSWCYMLVIAGHETTQSTFGAGVEALVGHPDQFRLLRDNPDLINGAVEEVLRYCSPVIHFTRTPNRDVEMHGRTIPAGEPVALFYPSANHDEAKYERPDVFDITRKSNHQLSFGSGPHQCLGMHLARMELRTMLGQFVRRVDHFEPAGPPTRVHSCVVGGYRKYPVRMTVRPA